MPQLMQLMTVYQSQWFWLLLVLGAIYILVGHMIVPKVEGTVDDRDAKIAADLEAAEKVQQEASRIEEEWRTRIDSAHAEAQAVTASAREKSSQEAQKRVDEADSKLDAAAEEAGAALAKARDAALAEIESVAAEAARDIVAKLGGGDVSEADARKAVAGVMSHG